MKPQSSLSHEDSKTLAFRVSQEDCETISLMIEASGYVKQDYLRERVLDTAITVYPNIRIRKYPEQYLSEIHVELQRISIAEDICTETLERLNILLNAVSQL